MRPDYLKPAKTTAARTAEFLIWHSKHHGDPISNLKLQKLLYYCQGWFLALNFQRLFSDPIEAWIRGPVVRSVWQQYKTHAWKPINAPIDRPQVSALVEAFLEEVIDVYGDMSAYTLESPTQRKAPWLKARGSLAPNANSSQVISVEDMFEYFSKLADRKN